MKKGTHSAVLKGIESVVVGDAPTVEFVEQSKLPDQRVHVLPHSSDNARGQVQTPTDAEFTYWAKEYMKKRIGQAQTMLTIWSPPEGAPLARPIEDQEDTDGRKYREEMIEEANALWKRI